MNPRTHCPSCRHRLSPLALECPVCGLSLARNAPPRPLLFQASALQARPAQARPAQARPAEARPAEARRAEGRSARTWQAKAEPEPRNPFPGRSGPSAGSAPERRKAAVTAPALGRVEPVPVPPAESSVLPILAEAVRSVPFVSDLLLAGENDSELPTESFWPLVRLEVTEAAILAGLNLIVAFGAAWLSGVGITRLYGELWHFLLPAHFAISWAFEMVPITLVGQSPVMGPLGLLLDSVQPERRIAFSLFHLVSVLLFPVSFLCMVLTPYHRTLAEILTGQEILARPLPRMR